MITLWARRFDYVKAAVKFKTRETAVRASERFTGKLNQRRQWTQENGLNPDLIEGLYRDLVNHFIEEELKQGQPNSA